MPTVVAVETANSADTPGPVIPKDLEDEKKTRHDDGSRRWASIAGVAQTDSTWSPRSDW